MSGDLVHPATGEVVSLDAPTDTLASHLEEIRRVEGDLRSLKRALTAEVLGRMDTARDWTIHAGAYELTAPKPARDWDTEKVRAALAELVGAGEITADAAAQGIRARTSYAVDARGMRGLLAVEGPVADALGECRGEPKERRVSVKRAGPVRVESLEEAINERKATT